MQIYFVPLHSFKDYISLNSSCLAFPHLFIPNVWTLIL